MSLPLYMCRQELVSTLRGSTTARADELADKVDAWLLAWEGRARAGETTALRREGKMRDKILRAAGAVPVLFPALGGWPAAVARRILRDPEKFGFEAPPDAETIRKVHRQLLAEAMTVASSTPRAPIHFYATSSTT